MEIVPIELFGLHVDVPFLAPVGFAAARMEDFAAELCDQKKGIPLRPDQFRLRRFDDLFDYELKANFFGDNGTLSRTAERVKLGIRNARTKGDWNIIQQTFSRFYTLMDFDAKTQTHLSAHAHAKFESLDERDEWLGRFAEGSMIHKPGALGHVRIPDWEKDIRVLIELSNAVQGAVFVAWDTQFPNVQEWESFFASLPTVMENSANYFDIGFEPFKERV